MRATPDPRFFESLGPFALGDLAAFTGASCPAPESGRLIEAVSVLSRADAAAVSFFSDPRRADAARETNAGACFVTEEDARQLPGTCVPLISSSPQAAWAACAAKLHRPRLIDPATPAIHPSAELEEGVVVGHGAVIGQGAQIGAGTVIGAGVVIGPGVAIGRGCEIGANAVLGFALIGDGVRIYAGAIVGESGFGLAAGPRGPVDIPQLGRVIIQDAVTVGAGTCIDRGAFDDTVIGELTKIDNMVQIAHNVQVGRACVLIAFVGISGSVVIGDGVQLGGRVGVADHMVIGTGARVAAGSGLMSNVPPGETWGGFPARPLRTWLRQMAWLGAAVKSRRGSRER